MEIFIQYGDFYHARRLLFSEETYLVWRLLSGEETSI